MSIARYVLAGATALALFIGAPLALTLVVVDSTPASPPDSTLLNTAALPAAAAPYIPLVEADGSLCSAISPALLAAQLDQESGFNAEARSSAGALGAAQFLIGTWKTWGHGSPFDPTQAVAAMARYDCALAAQMAGLASQTGIPIQELMLASYNAGPAAVLAAQGVPNNGQTKRYVEQIEALEATYTLQLVSDPAGSAFGLAVVAAAESQLGVPYSWGGGNFAGPSLGIAQGAGTVGFDCSGLVLYSVYRASGGAIKLPHSSELQATLGRPVTSGLGSTVLASGLLTPGDIIAFALSGGGDLDHAGVYAGDGKMIAAPHTGGVVSLQNLASPYWQNVPWVVRSFAPATPALVSSSGGWVTRSGDQLMLGGKPWRFVGWGSYQWYGGCGNANMTPAQLEAFFETMPPNSVIRLLDAETASPSAITEVVAAATQAHQRVLISLLDANGSCGSPYGNLNDNPSFFDPGNHAAWKASVGQLVSTYAGDPTVAMYEICNEPNVGDIGTDRTLAFYTEMSQFIRALAPRQMLESGTYGPYYSNGNQVWEALNSLVDVSDDHDYVGSHGPIQNAIQDGPLAAAIDRPLLIGEWDNDTAGSTDPSFWAPPAQNPPGVTSVQEAFADEPALVGVLTWALDASQVGGMRAQDVDAVRIPAAP